MLQKAAGSLKRALEQLGSPVVNEALARREYKGKGKTPFEQVQDGYFRLETYTTHLIEAMKTALRDMRQ